MPSVAVGLHFQESGASLFPGSVHCPLHGHMHVLAAHAIYRLARHAIGIRHGIKIRHFRSPGQGSAHGIVIILADKDYRQLPQNRHVECLVKNSLAGGAIPEKADGYPIILMVLVGKGNARPNSDLTPNDAVSAEEPLFLGKEVHAASLPSAAPRLLTVEFRHTGIGIHSLGQGQPMITIGCHHVVIITDGRHHAGRYGFLTNIKMAESSDFLHTIQLTGFFLEAAKQLHQFKPIEIGFFTKGSLHSLSKFVRKYKNFRCFPPLMRIKHIRLIQFRNYGDQSFSFPHTITGICGPNGTGKTNLIDALYMLCYTKSYFATQTQHCAQWGTEGFRIDGEFQRGDSEETITLRWQDNKKELFRSGNPYPRLRDHIGRYASVMVAPDDLMLINGGSEERRKWVDGILSQTDPQYLDALMAYQKALQARNAWWTENQKQSRPVAEREYYEQIMAGKAPYLFEQRKAFLEALLPSLTEIILRLSGSRDRPSVRSISDLNSGTMAEILKEYRIADQNALRTTRGLHRDDWEFRLDEMPIRRFASQGQKKTYLFALKLAQFHYLCEKGQARPFLLLDDLFEKLDGNRLAALLDIIQSPPFGQVFVTDTDSARLKAHFGAHADLGIIS